MIRHEEKEQKVDNDPVGVREEAACGSSGASDAGPETDNVAEDACEGDDTADKMAGEGAAAEDKAEEARQWQDKYLRLVAEFDNYRKRTLREKMDLIASGGEDVIKALLPVIDDIERALSAMDTATDVDAVRQGVHLIHQKLMDTLRARGVEEIPAVGLELDTDLHEAVAKFPVEEPQKGKIIDVVQKGYKLKDKVARFAKVVVGE